MMMLFENSKFMEFESSDTNGELEGSSLTKFSYKDLQKATYNFNQSTMIGQGGFGKVYKGILEDGKQIAVKTLCGESKQGVRRHWNLVELIGYCLEGTRCILVYEFLENNSLERAQLARKSDTAELTWEQRLKICLGVARGLAYLHGESKPRIVHRDIKPSNILLDKDFNTKIGDFGLARALSARKSHTPELTWKRRLEICLGVAQGLAYLHEGIKPCTVMHRDIKSSNILLDEDFNAKIGDFGFTKLSPGSITHKSTKLAGTTGYIAPEYFGGGRLTSKATDVYSFGVVLFEILCGRRSSTSSWGTTQKVPLERLRNRWLYEKYMVEPLDIADDFKFRIRIKTRPGKTISVVVGTSDTIRSLKLKIPPGEWIHRGDLPDLVYNGEYLNDNRTLDSYNISWFSTLECQLGMKISIRTMSGKTVSVKVDSSNTTIGNLKAKIQDTEGVHQYKQKLFFDGRQLENYCTLADYKIEAGSTLLLVPRLKGWINIYIKTLTVNPISLEVKSSDTIGDVKVKISDMVGVPPFNQNFFFVGEELLDDDRTLYDYHIRSESTLFLVPVRRGRMKIYVETVVGNTIPLDVISRYTIGEVKSLIQDKEGIPTSEQTLFYAGHKLDDSRTLVYYLVQKEATLRLVDNTLVKTEPMQIHVEIVATGKTIPLHVETSDTISSVKSKIQSQEEIPYEQQCLFLPQIQLKDDSTLADYYIQNGSTLHLSVKS